MKTLGLKRSLCGLILKFSQRTIFDYSKKVGDRRTKSKTKKVIKVFFCTTRTSEMPKKVFFVNWTRVGTSLGSGSKARAWKLGLHRIRPRLSRARALDFEYLSRLSFQVGGQARSKKAGQTSLNWFKTCFFWAQNRLDASFAEAWARLGLIFKAGSFYL